MKRPWIAAILVATIFIVFRIITASQPDLANFSPVAALLFCGAAFWKSNKWMLPTALAVWLISSPIVNLIQGYPFHSATLVTLLAFAVVVGIGLKFAGKSVGKLIFGTILGATAFYLVTNTAAFIVDPVYAKTLDGYIQCMWTGSPAPTHGTPTYTFFRNSLVANSLGTALFLVAMSIPTIQKATQFKLITQTA
ncbi:MAG: DUF6580 family putative transport protein [Akkermansiaceae bacterium]